MYMCFLHAYSRTRRYAPNTFLLCYSCLHHQNANQYRFKLVYLLNGSEHGNSFGRTCGGTFYFDNCVQIQRLPGEDTNATLTLYPQPKRRCTVWLSRAPQAPAKKILRISYIIQFLYFALLLQSHNKYFNHEDTVNVHSLKNWKHFTLIQLLAAHRFQNGQCVFSNPVRFHANETNVQTLNNSKVYIKRRYCTKRTGSRTLAFWRVPGQKYGSWITRAQQARPKKRLSGFKPKNGIFATKSGEL